MFIIRVKDVNVIPKFLSLYLNSNEGQKEISKIVTGASYLQSIIRKSLEDFKIPIPPIIKQKAIIALNENMQAQEKIQEKKNQIKKIIINTAFTNLTKKQNEYQ